MKKITIKSVAKKAGVSTAAVSYALSGKRKISPKVFNKIMKAIDELGYKPNVIARNLASRKTWTVGLYTSPTKNIREDIFINSLLAGILDNLHEKKYQLQLYADYYNENTEDHPDLSMTQPIDGALIMNPRVNDVYLDYLIKQAIPFVVIGTPSEPEKMFYVDVDSAAATYTATKYLISKGHSNILFINGPAEYMQSVHHLQGSKMAMHENGLKINPGNIIHIPMIEEAAYNALKSFGPGIRNYSAILACHDVFSYGVMSYLKENNIHVPQDIAYISLGNSQFCRFCTPSVTSMDLAPYEMGFQSGEMLVDIIEKRRIQPSHTIIPVKLIERESV
ncbi:MAG: LacI family DNA-binding transcriptional regulator [Spirochaetales bacterium]|nr:LacI family DNA-binding transcriptional regulator [Spirochaetales bacterium]